MHSAHFYWQVALLSDRCFRKIQEIDQGRKQITLWFTRELLKGLRSEVLQYQALCTVTTSNLGAPDINKEIQKVQKVRNFIKY